MLLDRAIRNVKCFCKHIINHFYSRGLSLVRDRLEFLPLQSKEHFVPIKSANGRYDISSNISICIGAQRSAAIDFLTLVSFQKPRTLTYTPHSVQFKITPCTRSCHANGGNSIMRVARLRFFNWNINFRPNGLSNQQLWLRFRTLAKFNGLLLANNKAHMSFVVVVYWLVLRPDFSTFPLFYFEI